VFVPAAGLICGDCGQHHSSADPGQLDSLEPREGGQWPPVGEPPRFILIVMSTNFFVLSNADPQFVIGKLAGAVATRMSK